MEDIIAPVSKELLKAELTADKNCVVPIKVIMKYMS